MQVGDSRCHRHESFSRNTLVGLLARLCATPEATSISSIRLNVLGAVSWRDMLLLQSREAMASWTRLPTIESSMSRTPLLLQASVVLALAIRIVVNH